MASFQRLSHQYAYNYVIQHTKILNNFVRGMICSQIQIISRGNFQFNTCIGMLFERFKKSQAE